MKKVSIKNINPKELFSRIRDYLVVDKLNAIEWWVLGFILLLITLTFFYGDNLGMFLTYFWINEGLFDGGSIRFLGNNQLTYGIVQQIFCEVWTLPCNIVYRFVKFEPANTATVLWYKLSMAFVMVLCLSEMAKLAKSLGITKERIKWMLILMLSSILVALPVFHIAQSDILYGFFVIAGIHALIKGDRKKFILFFAMAISCKAIAAVVFIPLVLLNEKRILIVIRDVFMGVVIFPAERVWYKIVDAVNTLIFGRYAGNSREVTTVVDNATVTVEKTMDQINTDFLSHFYHKALYFEIPAIRKGYVASILVVLFVLLCLWCYIQSKEKNELWNYNCIYVAAVAWMLFFANASPSPYWIVAMYPCWFILIFINPGKIRTNLLLINGFTLSMFVVYIIDTYWVYGGANNLDYLLLKGILPASHDSTVEGPYVARYLNNLGIGSFMNVITAVCFATVIGLVYVNHSEVKINDMMEVVEEKKLMHGFALFQIAVLAVWYVVVVLTVSRW